MSNQIKEDGGEQWELYQSYSLFVLGTSCVFLINLLQQIFQ